MRTIQQLTTLVVLLLTVGAAAARGQREAYDDELRKADGLVQRRQYEEALQSYKKAFALSNKTSFDAWLGMALAYRSLGAHKNVADACADGLKLAGDAKQVANVHNLRGAALVALSDKPDDKRLEEAQREFLAAVGANEQLYTAHLNLGITLLKMNKDEEGVRVLKHYVEVAPKGKEVDNALKMIDEPRRARETFAPDFSFTSKQGEFVTLEDLKGKTILLDFWGTWCKPCLMATPDLLKLYKKFSEQGVVFIGVAVNDQEDSWAAYIEKNRMEWPQFFDKTRKMATPFGINSYPTYIIIDGEGIVRARHSGYSQTQTQGWIEDEIKRTLKKKGPA